MEILKNEKCQKNFMERKRELWVIKTKKDFEF